MLQSLGNLLALDGRSTEILVGVAAALVLAIVVYALYRFGFAHRIRTPGGARGRAPRLGVVDVFGLDGQRQLVIVRRDNIEHLLMIGGPNDLVIESQILRNAANGRESAKPQAVPAAEPPGEPLQAIPAAVAPRPAAPAASAPVPRRAPINAPANAPAASEPTPPPAVIVVPRADRPSAAPAVAVEPPPETRLRPVPKAEILPPKPPAETPPKVAEVEAEALAPKPALDLPLRKSLTPARPVAATPRPHLPSPITPLRPRGAAESTAPEPAPRPTPEAPPKPEVALKPETPSKPPEAIVMTPPADSPTRPRKDDAFYDLESLEAEMARLLGRDA